MFEETETEAKRGRPALIKVECKRQFGLEDKDDPTGVRQVMPGEEVKISKEAAQKLSDVGAARIIL